MNNSQIKKYIGAKLKSLRENAGLNQESVASLLKLSRVSVVNSENGKHGLKYASILRLCELYGCTTNDIFPPISSKRFSIKEKTINVKKTIKVIKASK